MPESKGLQPTIEDGSTAAQGSGAILEMKRDDLKPKVRSYADNLSVRIRNILASHNIASVAEFNQLACEKDSPLLADLALLEHLAGLLNQIWETGEIPKEAATTIEVISDVRDIQNPFFEVWNEPDNKKAWVQAKGNDPERTLERFEIDLGEILDLCKQTYRAKGLDSWANALPATVADIVAKSPEQQKRFETYLKEGRIPLFMPPASVQLESMKAALYAVGREYWLRHFRPDVIAGGVSTEAEETCVSWDYLRELMETKDRSLVTGVPDTWYILWVQPTREPQCMGKTLTYQKKYIEDEQKIFTQTHRTTEPLIGGMMPAEYCALQTVFSKLVLAQAKKDAVSIQTVNPLDEDTWTRFPGVEESSGGSVAGAGWETVDCQLWLDGGVVKETLVSGVRLPVREIIGVES